MGRNWISFVSALALFTTSFLPGQIQRIPANAGNFVFRSYMESTTCLPLKPPELTSPEDNGAVLRDPETGKIPADVMLQWTALPGVQEYRVEVYNDFYGSNPVTANASTNEISLGSMLNKFALIPLGSYTWRVARIDSTAGCPYFGPFSELRTFHVEDNLVFKPVNLQASDGAYLDRVKLTWELDTSQGQYMPDSFAIRRGSTFDLSYKMVEIASGLQPSARSYEDTQVVTNEEYFYEVVARNETYGEQTSRRDTGFATPACLPVGTPQLSYPENGGEVWLDPDGSTEDGLTWERVIGVKLYDIEVRDANTGETWSGTVEWNSYIFDHHQIGTYQWRVRALSPVEGCEEIGAWTEYWTFKFYISTTYPVINLNASDGAYPDKVVLTWAVDPNREEEYVRYLQPYYFSIDRVDQSTGERIGFQETVPYDGPGSNYRYEDQTAEPGKKYDYIVTSDREIGYTSSSDPDEGWAGAAGVLQILIYLPIIGR